MKTSLLVAAVGGICVYLALSVVGRDSTVFAQRAVPYEASGELTTFSTQLDANRQQLTVVDPKARVIAVYHIELGTGQMTLKSVRNIYWDLQIVDFNGTSPSPRDVRNQLETRSALPVRPAGQVEPAEPGQNPLPGGVKYGSQAN